MDPQVTGRGRVSDRRDNDVAQRPRQRVGVLRNDPQRRSLWCGDVGLSDEAVTIGARNGHHARSASGPARTRATVAAKTVSAYRNSSADGAGSPDANPASHVGRTRTAEPSNPDPGETSSIGRVAARARIAAG